jgi:ribosome-associated protein
MARTYKRRKMGYAEEDLGVVVLDESDAGRLTRAVIAACEDAKGKEITVLGMKGVSDVADYYVVVSGRSDRHVQGICNRILGALDDRGMEPYSVEGYDDAHWVILDCGDVLVHVFYEPVRKHFDIESLWGRAPRLLEGKKAELAA